MRRIPSLEARGMANIEVTLPRAAGHKLLLDETSPIPLRVQYYKFVSDIKPVTEVITFNRV